MSWSLVRQPWSAVSRGSLVRQQFTAHLFSPSLPSTTNLSLRRSVISLQSSHRNFSNADSPLSSAKSEPLLAELRRRGLVCDVTSEDVGDHLDEGSTTVYCGFDPTAETLHVGNLVALMTLVRLSFIAVRLRVNFWWEVYSDFAACVPIVNQLLGPFRTRWAQSTVFGRWCYRTHRRPLRFVAVVLLVCVNQAPLSWQFLGRPN